MKNKAFMGPGRHIGSLGRNSLVLGTQIMEGLGVSSGWIFLNPPKYLAPLVRCKAEKGLNSIL